MNGSPLPDNLEGLKDRLELLARSISVKSPPILKEEVLLAIDEAPSYISACRGKLVDGVLDALSRATDAAIAHNIPRVIHEIEDALGIAERYGNARQSASRTRRLNPLKKNTEALLADLKRKKPF